MMTPDPTLYSMEWMSESRSVVSSSLQHHGLNSPWNSPDQNTGVGILSLLQGDLPHPGVEPRSPALQMHSLLAEPQGKPIFHGCVCRYGGKRLMGSTFVSWTTPWSRPSQLLFANVYNELSFEEFPSWIIQSCKTIGMSDFLNSVQDQYYIMTSISSSL